MNTIFTKGSLQLHAFCFEKHQEIRLIFFLYMVLGLDDNAYLLLFNVGLLSDHMEIAGWYILHN